MAIQIEVAHKPGVRDAAGEAVVRRIRADLSLDVDGIRVLDVYSIDKDLNEEQTEKARQRLFTDPITQESVVGRPYEARFDWALEIGFLPGVTDNAGRTSRDGLQDLLAIRFREGEAVYTSKRYLISGALEETAVNRIAELLSNPLINRVAVRDQARYMSAGMGLDAPQVKLTANPRVDDVDLELADDELAKLGSKGILDRIEDGVEFRRGPLALDLESLHVIRDYFRSQGRSPTDVELEALAQTWSEHCKHTIFAAQIDEIDSLYKTAIRGATAEVRRKLGDEDWCVSVFSDNSGVIKFADGYNICYKVETHNSPSALDPYGGAITGIVGVNRDPLGTGIGAQLVTNMYGFCFGNPYYDKPLPYRQPGRKNQILHPKVIFEGVREGVEHGGNKSGIPTSWGFLTFDDRYMGKPLVFVGTLGLMPEIIAGKPSHEKCALPGDLIVMTGGRVGADGIHGATFSSEGLHEGSPAGAVQIGDPITQKKLADAQHEARDQGLYNSITDNGAGGLSCSICEMAEECGGCEVELDKVPIKYVGLAPNEIWISESQERMTYSIPPDKIDAFMDLMRRRDVEATIVGKFTDSGRSKVTFENRTVMDMDLEFLHNGLPNKTLRSTWTPIEHPEPVLPKVTDLSSEMTEMIGRLNICSKEYVVRQYDHEVQGGSVIKPLVGRKLDVHSDATVVRPRLESSSGVALSSALYPSYGDIDPYQMAACAIDTAIRNQVVVGADPTRIALLDNFCWCSSNEEERLGQLKLAALACYDLAIAHMAPFVSGKDSMFNDFKGFDADGKSVKISVPPTLLVSSVGVVHDVTSCTTVDAKCTGDLVIVLGLTRDELGGSEYYRLLGEKERGEAFIGKDVPKVNVAETRPVYLAAAEVIRQGLAASAGSVHQGGIAVALVKCAMGGRLGMRLELDKVEQEGITDVRRLMFSESQGRILMTIAPDKLQAVKEICADVPFSIIGEMTENAALIGDYHGEGVLETALDDLVDSYKKTLDW